MNEFTNSYQSLKGSLFRTILYTVGHIIIAMLVVSIVTGASMLQAGSVALIEPSINAVWFFILDRIFLKQ